MQWSRQTTASFTVLPELLNCFEFVNADSIAFGLSPLNPETATFKAGRLMLERIDYLLHEKKDFAIETTLTTLSYKNFIIKAKKKQYQIVLIYIWLANTNLAISRVNERVKKGGHFISEEIIKRRYKKGLINLFDVFIPLSDNWYIFDNSEERLIIISDGGTKSEMRIFNKIIWQKIKFEYDKSRISR